MVWAWVKIDDDLPDKKQVKPDEQEPKDLAKLIIPKDVIRAAWRGELTKACLIEVNLAWRHILGEAVWIVPDEAARARVWARDKDHLIFTPAELFRAVQTVAEQGEAAKGVFDAKRMFGGELLYDGTQEATDTGAGLSPADSHLWQWLISEAAKIDVDFAARLKYIRGTGAKLEPDARLGYKIVPIIDASGQNGWPSWEMYEAERWCLNPYREQLVGLLKRLAQGIF
ncbi:hypothetical protein [Sporolituus thermophilus]|uniref:Uncharacterized protein n=1 Tax=Sporolituus thermophilus DSM 23256 TaxID=1123285 RepID=A0A1G7MU62_9FIRM|nr:hypothetical protein [Sporolituus thermophilus]SDF65191.1 hypothetical protein SAMN05660235_02304 [Sporolituus thermophilus DSM 23256]